MTAESVEDIGLLVSVTEGNAVEQEKVKGNQERQQLGSVVSCLVLDS